MSPEACSPSGLTRKLHTTSDEVQLPIKSQMPRRNRAVYRSPGFNRTTLGNRPHTPSPIWSTPAATLAPRVSLKVKLSGVTPRTGFETNSFTTGSLRVKCPDLADRPDVLRAPARDALRAGLAHPGSLIFIATVMSAQRNPPALMIDVSGGRSVYLRCRDMRMRQYFPKPRTRPPNAATETPEDNSYCRARWGNCVCVLFSVHPERTR